MVPSPPRTFGSWIKHATAMPLLWVGSGKTQGMALARPERILPGFRTQRVGGLAARDILQSRNPPSSCPKEFAIAGLDTASISVLPERAPSSLTAFPPVHLGTHSPRNRR